MGTNERTENLDAVYFVKAFPTEDLKYSLRSVAKNLKCRRVVMIGGKPATIEPDRYIPVIQQVGDTKWQKVQNMYRQICLDDDISEDFILLHDDFFIMKPVEQIKPQYRGELEEHRRQIDAKFGVSVSQYSFLLRRALKTLKMANKSTFSYELHTPFIFNRHKLLEVMGAFPNCHCLRTIYANYFGIGGTKTHDVKIFDNQSTFDWKNEQWLSTDDSTAKDGNEVWAYLKNEFNKPCRYEKGRFNPEHVSLCKNCGLMTHTILTESLETPLVCGKCGMKK